MHHTMLDPEIENKLAAARTRLILDKPFLGALALRLPLVAADPQWCPASYTDARNLYFNPAYIRNLAPEQVQFVLAREALHCALSHFARRMHRNKVRWDIACEYSINPVLIKDGLKPPPATVVIAAYEGMTAEEIYPFIEEDDEADNQEKSSSEGDNPDPSQGGTRQGEEKREKGQGSTPPGKPPSSAGNSDSEEDENLKGQQDAPEPAPLSTSEMESLSIQWQQRMAGAALQAQQAGKLGGALGRMVSDMLQPKLPWRMLLARYMTQVARDDYSYARPSRREGDMIMPSLRSAQASIVVVLDTSGSIGEQELNEFVSEVDTLKAQLRTSVILHACDLKLDEDGPWVYEAWEEFKLPKQFAGGGGTDFRPVFDWLQREGKHPDMLLYFTDAEGEFPKTEPNYPVIWLVKGKAPVPWGQRIQLN